MEQTLGLGITKRILTPGDEAIKVTQKSKCTIDYTLFRINENTPIKIDSSLDRKLGLVFTIGDGQVITAIEECVRSMNQGEKAQFRIKNEYFDHGIMMEDSVEDFRLDVYYLSHLNTY
jgi:FKBP-type peptidyl-prolyl cis-trans isomerase 2